MDILDQTLVNQPTLNQTLVTEPAVELELEQGSDDTSSNLSFKAIGLAEEEEALAEDQPDSGTYCDAEPLVESDDVDYDQQDDMKADDGLQQPYLGRRGLACHPFGPEPRCGRVSHTCGPHGWDTCQGPSRLRSWQTCDENENKHEGNSFSSLQSDLGEVSLAMVGAGLYNLGNTCFLNAILQCFTHTVPLVEGLRSYNHPKPCERDSEGFCAFCALHNHIEIAITAKGKSLSPLKLVENLDKLSSDFRRYQQEDAHELLQSLLDKLDRCCNKSETDDSDESLVQRLFGGCLVSKLKCCNCGHFSDTFESLIDLSLEIENASSLPSALESFTKVEKIDDEESRFECESCKEKVAVEKQLMVHHAPSIAAFHLKRFKNDGSCVEKIDKHVEFPLELDLMPYTNGSQNDNVDLNYGLYAIVVHSGFSPTSGHYFCFIRSAPDAWYCLDDTQVTRVSESHVLSRDAYILLYAKNGTPWFSTFMETEKLTMDCNVSSSSPKSVLENANQNSESSPIMEANIISEVNEEDRKECKIISGLSFNNSRHEDEIGVAKVDSKIGKKLFPSSVKDDHSVISSTSFKPVFDIDEITESSRTMKTNIITDVNEEDRRDAMEISRGPLNDCGGKYGENEIKEDSKTEINLPSPAHRGDNSNQKDGKFTGSANFNSSTSQRSSSTIGISRLFFNDYALEDRVDGAKDDSKVVKKSSLSAFRGELEKSADVGSSTPSANPYSIRGDHAMTERELPCKRQLSTDLERKEASRLLKSMPCSKRRSQLLAVVNSNPEVCLNNKRTKMNEQSSSRKDRPPNALRNPNLVSLRRPVAPGRFR